MRPIGRETTACRAFTLIELVLVLVVMTVALALTAPSLRGWSQGTKLRDAGQQLLAATMYARTQAAATATPHRIVIDSATNAYAVHLLNGKTFGPVPGEWGKPNTLPTDYRIEWLPMGGELLGAVVNAGGVDFYPNGRTTPGVLRITSQTGETVEFASAVPAEPYKKVEVVQ